MNVLTNISDSIRSLGHTSRRTDAKRAAEAERLVATERSQAAATSFMDNQRRDREAKAREVHEARPSAD